MKIGHISGIEKISKSDYQLIAYMSSAQIWIIVITMIGKYVQEKASSVDQSQ